jgi:hypothetical protein
MSMNTDIATSGASIESRKDFEDDPQGQYRYWCVELDGAEVNLRDFTKQGDEIVKRYLADGRRGTGRHSNTSNSGFNLNLFYANTATLEATLFGNLPTVDVSRRFNDANDDEGRVAATIMERLLNDDVAVNGDECDSLLRTALLDRLTVGLGVGRVRYDARFDTDGEGVQRLLEENAILEYVHWRDIRWSWARKFTDITWIGFRSYLTKDAATERFGEDVAKRLEYKQQQALSDEDSLHRDDSSSSWQKAEIWELWDKTKKQVVWVSKGYDKVLDTKPDPLQLENFFPTPPFFAANVTSTLYTPVSDYHMAQDLYNEVDTLQTRIAIITEAVKVVGVYDAGAADIGRMLKEGMDNDLIPVDNWALFAEKGGIQGQIDWLPIKEIVDALMQLIGLRDQTIGLLQQVTGMSDLMRGELNNQYEGVGQTQIKAQMGSVRIQALQDKFAIFASKLFQLKAEVISKHFDPMTIARRSNAESMFDAELIEPALKLIKNYEQAKLSVNIRPETVAMVDYAALKNDRTEFLTAIATFMQSAAPLVEADESMKPFLFQLLQWGLSGFKGSSEIEGVIDRAIETSQKKAQEAEQQPEKPNPELELEKMKQQFIMQLEQFKAQAEERKIQMKGQTDIQVRQLDAQADQQTEYSRHQQQLELLQSELMAAIAEVKAKLEADVTKEQVQAEANIAQTNASASAEIQKGAIEHQSDMEGEVVKTQLKIDEIAASTKGKLLETKAQPPKGVSDA